MFDFIKSTLKQFVLSFLVILITQFTAFSQDAHQEVMTAETQATQHAEAGEKKLDIKKEIFGHIKDNHSWHFFSLGSFHANIPLPVIIFSPTKGLSAFMSSSFGHEGHPEEHNGYMLNEETGKIQAIDGSKLYDISITKNITSMFISIILLLLIMTSVAKLSKKNGTTKAPTGVQNLIEPCVTFIRDTVAIPNLGKGKYVKYMPLLLTMFFFIWINNLLGLIPGGANLTGNIAVTLVLALIFYVVMLANANKGFWTHMLNPPGVPTAIKFILVPIEILSNLLIKPAALAIRLFANIFAGHTIILSIILLIVIFARMSPVAGWSFAPVSVAFSVFMFCLELLVAAIQAFIFTNLTAVFIGQAIEDHHHDDSHGKDHH
jgi:F-type H+-transporting ATPase subunit a